MEYRSVAIDGPSGAGKSTLAKRLAQELGFLYVDTCMRLLRGGRATPRGPAATAPNRNSPHS